MREDNQDYLQSEQEGSQDTGGKLISRRKILGSIGAAGAVTAGAWLLGSFGGKLPEANADGAYAECCKMVTIAQLRALTTPETDRIYFVKDRDQEGSYYYDASDTSSADNTGIILVSTSGARFRRIFEGPAHVKWFGAKGDGTTDDTVAIQLAINSYSHIYFSPSSYRITDYVFLQDNSRIEGTRSSKIFMSTNPNGVNLISAKDKVNITIDNLWIEGVYGVGNPFPVPGVMEGQGVTLAVYGCRNVVITNCYFTYNGEGSGNIYVSKCKDVVVTNNFVEKSMNGICFDNWYGDNDTPGGTHVLNVTVANNVVSDMGGRAIAFDLDDKNSNIAVVGNTVRAAAYAAIAVNATGVTVVGNIINGKRDGGISTVGGQQSLPTYYGFLSNFHCEHVHLADNIFEEIFMNGVKILNGSSVSIVNNSFSFALKYLNQNNNQVLDLHEPNNQMISLEWDTNAYTSPFTIKIDNNTIVNDRNPTGQLPIAELISLKDISNSAEKAASSFIHVTNNQIRSKKISTAIQYAKSLYQEGGTGKLYITGNTIYSPVKSGTAILATRLEELHIEGNKINGIAIAIEMGTGGLANFSSNVIRNYNTAYFFNVSNLLNEIDQLIVQDTIIGNPAEGSYVFTGLVTNSYIVASSNGAGMKFIDVNVNQIKGTYYPESLVVEGTNSAPTAGRWAVGDRVTIKNVTAGGYSGFICTTLGTPGMWKQYGAILA
ncbi:right-handed parallel beta-helix repeat-containing protein [Paenibacillus sp. PAMC21692]|uniref:right-handed parallel beta-helix repeat-containing protein n=1 Tax=Paenibacillus sp. PAMC21692 TaxID=2762320 RepID=UPI00164E01B1|nr:right-handed parallel beta-helix repeat-containing protein [Paenibacillus sp. PAMC21692]QNK58584.1 right-handed parallel beta-helix repeat-containing protein [Paenibacillus sp. PAMC21692]